MYAFIYLNTYTAYTCIYVFTIRIYMCMYIYIYTCVCVYVYASMCKCIGRTQGCLKEAHFATQAQCWYICAFVCPETLFRQISCTSEPSAGFMRFALLLVFQFV